MSAESRTPRSRRDELFEDFGAWMFSFGFISGIGIGFGLYPLVGGLL